MIFDVRAAFEVVLQTDTHLVLIDLDQGASVTNDADAVIAWLAANLEGGIGKRKVYYRDTDGRFDELKVNAGVASCSEGRQTALAEMYCQ
ncbi:TPA: hypothetical protein MB314_005602 [Klebsiella pneumoniae]|nr:hypothetical protein [Klebsiella pneumoniae]